MHPSTCLRNVLTALAVAGVLLSGSPLLLAQKGGGKPKPEAPRTISFLGFNTSQNAQINLVREDGSGVVTVNSKDIWQITWPRWSPGGTMIGGYYKDLKNDFGIMALRSDGSQEHIVVTEKQFNAWNLSRPGVLESSLLTSTNYPCWLGNGAMVFAGKTRYDPTFFGESDLSFRSNGHRLFIAAADGGIWPLTETRLQNAGPSANGNYYDADPHWSPVLEAIVFISNRSGCDELYAIAPDGTGLTRITDFRIRENESNTAVLFTPVWSPQADRIALAVNFETHGNPLDLLILDVDLSQPDPGTGPGGRVTGVEVFKHSPVRRLGWPSWSPGGDRLLFKSFDPDRWSRIIVADAATGAENVVVEAQRRDGYGFPDVTFPDWSPAP